MDIQVARESIETDEAVSREYNLLIDGIIELEAGTDVKMFFDGLLDAIVEYAEKHSAMAGLSLSHREYYAAESDDTEEEDGGETA